MTKKRPKQSATDKLYGANNVSAANEFLNRFLPSTDASGKPSYGMVSTQLEGEEDVLNRMRSGLGGYTSPEYQAQREQMMRGQNSNLQTSLSQLAKAQARGRVYGAAASAQQANTLQSAQNTKDTLEQDLYVKNIDEQQKRLGVLAEEQGKAREETLGREKFNIGSADAYKSSQLAAWLGIAGLGLSKTQQAAMQKIYERGIAAVA